MILLPSEVGVQELKAMVEFMYTGQVGNYPNVEAFIFHKGQPNLIYSYLLGPIFDFVKFLNLKIHSNIPIVFYSDSCFALFHVS